VTIYTNKADWWDVVMKPAGAGEDIIKNHPIWIARYSKNAPAPDPTWTGSGVALGMPPLPADATYPAPSLSKPDFWQFTENGIVQFAGDGSSFLGNGIACRNKPSVNTIDLNYTPIAGADFVKVFGISEEEVVVAEKTPSRKRRAR
jgi:hypothetical protein